MRYDLANVSVGAEVATGMFEDDLVGLVGDVFASVSKLTFWCSSTCGMLAVETLSFLACTIALEVEVCESLIGDLVESVTIAECTPPDSGVGALGVEVGNVEAATTSIFGLPTTTTLGSESSIASARLIHVSLGP